jgi:hypothetical protein
LLNFEIIKDMINNQSRQSARQHDEVMMLPVMGPAEGIARPEEPPPFEGYVAAQAVISAYAPRLMMNATAASLKKLRVGPKMVEALRNWLLHSDTEGANCLWLLSRSSASFSAIAYDVAIGIKLPVLAYSCRQLDEQGNEIATRTLFTQMLYAFLDSLLIYLSTSKEARTRIDSSIVCRLNGDFSSAEPAITMLANLLDNVPVACVCIIDNFHRLDVEDDPQTTSLLKDFLGVFRQDAGRTSSHFSGRHKLLLTTRGPSDLLAALEEEGNIERLSTDAQIDKGKYLVWQELETAAKATQSN